LRAILTRWEGISIVPAWTSTFQVASSTMPVSLSVSVPVPLEFFTTVARPVMSTGATLADHVGFCSAGTVVVVPGAGDAVGAGVADGLGDAFGLAVAAGDAVGDALGD